MRKVTSGSRAFVGVLALVLCLCPLACGGDDDDNNDCAEVAPAGLSNVSVRLIENGGAVDNTWTFPDGAGTSGTATMDGGGDFPFTYSKAGPCTSALEFDVGGTDRFNMVWTSASGGNFVESFDGAGSNPGTFTVTPL